MSRSFKKNCVNGTSGSYYRKWAKRQASKKVRHSCFIMQDGGWYKKKYNSWNIEDYRYAIFTPSEARVYIAISGIEKYLKLWRK